MSIIFLTDILNLKKKFKKGGAHTPNPTNKKLSVLHSEQKDDVQKGSHSHWPDSSGQSTGQLSSVGTGDS